MDLSGQILSTVGQAAPSYSHEVVAAALAACRVWAASQQRQLGDENKLLQQAQVELREALTEAKHQLAASQQASTEGHNSTADGKRCAAK